MSRYRSQNLHTICFAKILAENPPGAGATNLAHPQLSPLDAGFAFP
jgi:hypothetical protein